MPLVGVDQDHHIVSEFRIFDIGVLAIAGNFLRSLQHPIHLIEVEVAEQWGNYTALRNADRRRLSAYPSEDALCPRHLPAAPPFLITGHAGQWIAPALTSPDLVLGSQPPAQPHSRVVVERAIGFAGGADLK